MLSLKKTNMNPFNNSESNTPYSRPVSAPDITQELQSVEDIQQQSGGDSPESILEALLESCVC